MMKGKYDRILDQFEQYYPDLYRQTVDWWPSGRYHITVKLEDTLIFEFDATNNTIWRVRPDNYKNDINVLRTDIGHNIQKLIFARGIPQSEIASRVGITEAMLSRYIHGTSMPGIDKVYSLASALGCRVIDILGEAYDEQNT